MDTVISYTIGEKFSTILISIAVSYILYFVMQWWINRKENGNTKPGQGRDKL